MNFALPQDIAFPGIHGEDIVLVVDGKWTPNLPQIRKKLATGTRSYHNLVAIP